jgi:hypothetical protein
MFVDVDLHHGVGPEPELRSRFFHCEVRDLRAENPQPASFGWQAGLLGGPFPVLLKESVACQKQSHVVRLRAACSESAVRADGQSDLGAKPANHLLFDHRCDRGLIEGIHRLV